MKDNVFYLHQKKPLKGTAYVHEEVRRYLERTPPPETPVLGYAKGDFKAWAMRVYRSVREFLGWWYPRRR